jgi:YHS domain-containing protein
MAMQVDPVCGMQIDDQKAPAKSQHQGDTYYFCSEDCKMEFDQQPQRYIRKAAQAQAQGGGQTKRSQSHR